jgi:hypothetical protein
VLPWPSESSTQHEKLATASAQNRRAAVNWAGLMLYSRPALRKRTGSAAVGAREMKGCKAWPHQWIGHQNSRKPSGGRSL